MAHNVEQMFSVREVPWHGLGRVVKEAPSAADAIKLAGLDWEVLSKQVYRYEEDDKSFQRVKDYQALVRSDNMKTLAIMKETYTPLQNKDAFDFFNPYIDSGLASFETAGSLREGKVVWVLATLNKAPIEVGKGDEVNKYLLLSNGHDGMMAVRVGFTPIRVVCNNTLSASHGDKRSQLIRIKHSKSVKQRVEDVQSIVNAIDAKFEATAEQYKRLAKCDVNQKDLQNYVNVVFDLNPKGDEREMLRAKKMQETIQKLFENGAGAKLKSARGTMWGAYNAVTEFLTHEYGKQSDPLKAQESRLYNNWFGTLHQKNDQALKVALEAL